MSRQLKNAESGAATLIIVLVMIIALVGSAGFVVWKKKSDSDKKKRAETTQQEQAKAAENAKVAAEAKRVADAKAKLKLAASPYKSTDLGDIYYPDGWKVTEAPDDGVLFAITSPTADKDTNGNEFTPVITVAASPTTSSVADLVQKIKAADATTYENNKVVAERTAKTSDGTTLNIIESTYKQGSLQLRSLQAIAVEDGVGIAVTASALERDWPIYQDIFDQVLTK